MADCKSPDPLDAILQRQQHLTQQVARHFGASTGPVRVLSAEEKRQARVLLSDLNHIVESLSQQSAATGLATSRAVRSASASLAYLTVGRTICSANRVPLA